MTGKNKTKRSPIVKWELILHSAIHSEASFSECIAKQQFTNQKTVLAEFMGEFLWKIHMSWLITKLQFAMNSIIVLHNINSCISSKCHTKSYIWWRPVKYFEDKGVAYSKTQSLCFSFSSYWLKFECCFKAWNYSFAEDDYRSINATS